MDRRRFLIALGAGGAAAAGLAGCSDDEASSPRRGRSSSTTTASTTSIPVPPLPGDPFTLGVASGDPDAASVILWTRLAPTPLVGGGMPDAPVPVRWEVAADEGFADVVSSGVAVAEPDWAHSLHVEAGDLEPDTWYWYRFSVGDQYTSPVGRTRTAPDQDADVDRLRFGFASCQHWESGWYNAHRDIAADADLDLLVFLGDYIYEYGANPVRPGESVRTYNSEEVTDLAGYRNRYALHRTDAHLQAAHARCPWMVIWDDHEVENNHAGDHSEDTSVDPAAFRSRRAAAYQAWYEHTPVRLDPPAGADYRIHRTFRWGTLASIFLTDERQYRTDQACGDVTLDLGPACGEEHSEGRTMLGDEQLQWLLDGLDTSDATWRVWANEVVMTPITVGRSILNYDQWDGYPDERKKVLDHIDSKGMTNVVVVTGDIHLAGVGDLTVGDGDARRVVATELVGTSISSGGLLPAGTEDLVTSAVPAIKYVNSSQRGWTVCDVTPERWTAEFRMVEDNLVDGSPLAVDATFAITPDRPGATRA